MRDLLFYGFIVTVAALVLQDLANTLGSITASWAHWADRIVR